MNWIKSSGHFWVEGLSYSRITSFSPRLEIPQWSIDIHTSNNTHTINHHFLNDPFKASTSDSLPVKLPAPTTSYTDLNTQYLSCCSDISMKMAHYQKTHHSRHNNSYWKTPQLSSHYPPSLSSWSIPQPHQDLCKSCP